jgi:hypothetical protein
VLNCGLSIALFGIAVTLAACSSDADRSKFEDPSTANTHLRYYGGPKNGLWPDADAKTRE